MAPTIIPIRAYDHGGKYVVDFFGDELIVTVTTCPSEISKWISNVVSYHKDHSSHPLVVGVGVNWIYGARASIPTRSATDSDYGYESDTPSDSYLSDGQADILQLCVGQRCLIIQLAGCDHLPKILHSFVEDEKTTFVGIWSSQDAKRLKRSRHGLEIGKILDIRNYVEDSKGRNMEGCRFDEIVEECMGHKGVTLDPEIGMSKWCIYRLHSAQILQATVDAYVCFKIGVERGLWECK